MGTEALSWAEQWGAGGIGAMEDGDTRSQKDDTKNKNLSGITKAKATASNCLKWIKNLYMATGYSQECCEELVAAEAIVTLLRLTRSLSCSKPDEEVLKHALSTLRNLANYPHLLKVLIQTRDSLQIVVIELLRNKEEGYFIASELLKKICSTHIGAEALLKSPALLKRMHGLVEELTRKAIYEKRNARGPSPIIRENKERRLKEVVEILKLIAHA